MTEIQEISFKPSYATEQSIFIPVSLIVPLLAIILILWVPYGILFLIGTNPDLLLFCVLTFGILALYIVFFHGNPWRKYGKLHTPPKVIVANETFFTNDSTIVKPLIGKRVRQNLKGEKEVIHAIEDKIHLAKMLRIRLEGLDFGAYLQENSLRQLVVVWVFECAGIPYSLSHDQYNLIAQKIEAGLSDFSRSGVPETITIDAEVRSDHSRSLSKTKEIRESRTLPPEDIFILDGIDDRIKDLARDGRLAKRSLRIYATTNLSQMGYADEEMELDDRIQAFIDQRFASIKSQEDAQKDLKKRLITAYEEGFKKWRRMLESKLGLDINIVSLKDAWQFAWDEANEGEAPVPNHVITLSEKGMNVMKSDDKRLLPSLLFQSGEPTLAKDFVLLPGRKQYLGICVMSKYPNRIFPITERKEQFAYGSSAINNTSALNTRIIVQLSTVSAAKAKFASNWRVKTEASGKSWRKKRELLDVDSDVMMEEAVEAARSRKKGASSIKWAWIAMVYRPSIPQLNDAISSLAEHSSFSGNIALRERCYCDQLWITSMPALSSHKMLQKTVKPETQFCSFERRLENETQAVVGVLPLMREHALHKKGYQLVSRMKEPIFLDPCGKRPHLNFIFLGEKGCGKSKLVQGVTKNAMMQGARAIIIDGARTDGSGSFDEWSRYEPNAAYFNPNRDAYNIFEAVDQRYLIPFDDEDPDSIDIWGGIEGFLLSSLSELSYQGSNVDLSAKIKQIHSYFVGEFYRDPSIRKLRDLAFDGGMDSTAWQQMPTLHHYLDFLCIENLPEKIRSYVDPEALGKTKAALYALLQQKLGKAIARPTNVNFDNAQLIVYAMSAIAESDMLPLGIAMTGSILAQTNKTGLKSIVFEEMALNLRHKVLALMAAEAAAQGRKKNQHCIFVSQDIDPIVKSPAGNDIIKNSPVTVVGEIVAAAVDGISESRKIPREALIECSQASFRPKDEDFGRNFLIATKEGHLFATDYPDFRSLFMVMNESDEIDLKTEMKELYPNNKFKRIDEGAKILRSQSIHGATE